MDGAAEDEVRAPVGLELGVVRLFFLASSLGRARAQKQIVWTCGPMVWFDSDDKLRTKKGPVRGLLLC